MPIAEPFAAHVLCGCGWDVDEDADEKSPAGLLNPWNLRATDTLPNSRLPRPRIFPLSLAFPHMTLTFYGRALNRFIMNYLLTFGS